MNKYDITKHEPKSCFICLGLRWDGRQWVKVGTGEPSNALMLLEGGK